MRVLLDANVFVSAAIQRGASYRIVQRWLSGEAEFQVVMCPELLGEIRDVLTTRPRLRKWISLDAARRYVDALEALVDLSPDPEVDRGATRDAGDDYIIALARAESVDVIVSGDKDLLEWPDQQPPVMPPADFDGLAGT